MELKNRRFQYGKYRLAGRGKYQPSVSCVLSPLSQNRLWSWSPCRYLELPNWWSL